jgi:hypothetical protein
MTKNLRMTVYRYKIKTPKQKNVCVGIFCFGGPKTEVKTSLTNEEACDEEKDLCSWFGASRFFIGY